MPVTFVLKDERVDAEAEAGMTLLDAARRVGVLIAASCGGRGTCGTCAVEVLEGELAQPDEVERNGLRRARPGVRLACRARVSGPVCVRPLVPVPQTQVVSQPGSGAAAAGVDLGTTTIAARIAGPEGARGSASVINPQTGFGADVASRLAAASRGAWLELQVAAARGVEEALGLACERAGCAGFSRVALAANTAMAHLLLGADVTSLAVSPHRPAYSGIVHVSAGGFGSRLASRIVVLPHMGGFVGGDATAAALALGLDRTREPSIMLDLGTNAEIVLAHDGGLTAASAAAGPAFEGAGVTCGGPAVESAVTDAHIAGEALELAVLGDQEAMWLAGSGVVALLAELRSAGHLNADGRLLADGPLSERFHERAGVLCFQVAGSLGQLGDVYLSQLDVREVQLAKAAVAVAAAALLEDAGLTWEDLSAVHLAGAFGVALRTDALVSLGVMPEVAGERAVEAGNAALAGAVMVAEDESLEARVETMAARTRVADLAGRADFGERLLAALSFPG